MLNVGNFIGALALHQYKRDMALGLNHITTMTRGLLWYYNIKQRELSVRFAQAELYNTIIQTGAIEVKSLINKAHKNPEEAVEILKRVRKLEARIKKARKELKWLM